MGEKKKSLSFKVKTYLFIYTHTEETVISIIKIKKIFHNTSIFINLIS